MGATWGDQRRSGDRRGPVASREMHWARLRRLDQAGVEQKNGAVVRRLVGYGRLAAAQALTRLYDSSRIFVNFFQPSFKLLEKTRNGARVKKKYSPPETPCARLLDCDDISERAKQRLRAVAITSDPLRPLDEMRAVQHHIAGLGRGEYVHAPPQRDADLEGFLKSLAVAWKSGEVRPIHQAANKPSRHWRTRKDPFEQVWPTIVLWLENEPERTSKELFERLTCLHPGDFGPGQIRTLQRRVREWRRAAARRLVLGPREPANSGASPDEAVGKVSP